MGDPMYTNDIFMDGLAIKSEPMAIDNLHSTTSASVPIPNRRAMDFSDLRDGFDFNEASPCNSSFQDTNLTESSIYSGASMWSPRSEVKMEDDDIFQVDKADLIQGPTLAELNANDETLLGDLSFDDLVLPEESLCLLQVANHSRVSYPLTNSQLALSFPTDNSHYREFLPPRSVPFEIIDDGQQHRHRPNLSPASHHSSSSSLAMQSPPPPGEAVSPLPQKQASLHDLLLNTSSSPQQQILGQSVPGRYQGEGGRGRKSHTQLSSSAPTHLGLEQLWQRREPRQHLLSTGSLAEATSTSSISTGGILSPEAHDYSLDECFDSEDDSDHYEDFSSDAESGGSDIEGGSSSIKSSSSRKERFFWQYNVQAKGPKGQRLVLKTKQEDPHHLNEITDPVFSPQCSVQGIKHSGKARKGDGNDLTPNPKKLHVIGKELDKLNRTINDMTPVSELPFDVRPRTRKEKNKLASRACRLKKKAQHEANKIKLQGLECEHKRLINGISQMKQIVLSRVSNDPPDKQEIAKMTEKVVKQATKVKIAGQTTDFVNKILEKVKQGVPGGGLDDI